MVTSGRRGIRVWQIPFRLHSYIFCKEKAPVNKETQGEQLLNPGPDVEDIPLFIVLADCCISSSKSLIP